MVHNLSRSTLQSKNAHYLRTFEHFMYLTESYFSDNTPNQILHIMSTILLWSKRFYTTIGQHPTLYDFLAIMQEGLFRWEYHLDNPNMSVNLKLFQPTLLPHHCTLMGCQITCMIQVNLTSHLSVIPPTRHVCPYASHVNHLSVIPSR